MDLENERQVTKEEGQELAKRLKIPFYETSAKNRGNIEESIFDLVRLISRTKSTGHQLEYKVM
jgi:hypothetical protein